MARIVVENGGELKPTAGHAQPVLEVRYDSRIRQYKIIQYRDDRTSSTDQINTPYSNSALAHAEKSRLMAEYQARKAGQAVTRTIGG